MFNEFTLKYHAYSYICVIGSVNKYKYMDRVSQIVEIIRKIFLQCIQAIRSHKCEICKQTFAGPVYLKCHILVHVMYITIRSTNQSRNLERYMYIYESLTTIVVHIESA